VRELRAADLFLRYGIKNEPARASGIAAQALTSTTKRSRRMAEAQQRVHEALKRATAQMDSPTALMTLARYKASTTVKAQRLASGRRLAELTAGDVRIAADEYLRAHPELIQQAAVNH